MSDVESAVEEVVHPRRNGWRCPWHPFQAIAWFFILFFTTAHFGFLVFYIPGLWRIFAYIVPGLVLLSHMTANIVTTTIDPAEPEVRRKFARERHLRPIFDRSVHEHVIENRHCNLCDVDVSENAKHCRICDKCVCDFDHHCHWLNTCIGSRNYRWFLATLFSALTGAVMLFLYNTSLFVLYFADRDSLRYNCDHPTNTSACDSTLRAFGGAIPDPVFPTVTAVLAVLAIVAIILIGHLFTFHLFLISKGLSTYDYIMLQREREAKSSTREEAGSHGRCGFLRRKLNRVSPTSQDDEDEERSSGGSGDTASVGSNNSAGMANFGRTPPPSAGGSLDNLTDEEKLGMVASWAFSGEKTNNNVELQPLPVPRKPEKEESERQKVSILRKPEESVELCEPAVISNGVETAINMEALPSSLEDKDDGVGHTPTGSTEMPIGCESEQLPKETPTTNATVAKTEVAGVPDCGALAVSSSEEEEEQDPDCSSTLAAMVSSSSVDEEEDGTRSAVKTECCNQQAKVLQGQKAAAMQTDSSSQLHGEPQSLSDVSEAGTTVMVQASSSRLVQTLKERHDRLKAETQQMLRAISPPCTVKEESVGTYGSLTEENLASCPPPFTLSPEPPKKADQDTSPIPPEKLAATLQEIPLSALKSVGGIEEATEMERSPSPLTKKVSFEKNSSGEPEFFSPMSGRPLPHLPLPPISSALEPVFRDPVNYVHPHGLRSRPLPPIGYEDLLSSRESLSLSGSSQIFHSSSTNSLPLPDPRYKRGALPKLAISNLSLESDGSARATRKSKGMDKGKTEQGSSYVSIPPPYSQEPYSRTQS